MSISQHTNLTTARPEMIIITSSVDIQPGQQSRPEGEACTYRVSRAAELTGQYFGEYP